MTDEYLNSWDRRRENVGRADVKKRGEEENEGWNWERWRKHFAELQQQNVGRVMSHLKKAVQEEYYGDAALVCDYAGAGLVE
ncbi:Hypothetical predicted protein [Olea europaea subsp. europaea]|uniref:Uncharacterized protein n=1 Tax=Olea europaea subsp. europaea TaxID=158383 RepID=A0A8S0Q6R1_OLEEU|nr:Hypothetical predicted protein [Olea europaea subsp. europaea]